MPTSLRLSKGDSTVHARMRTVLSSIQQEYDFSTFTWPGFVTWLSQRRGKALHFVPIEQANNVFGGWITTPDADFIFYDDSALPIHQLHIQLHEIAHMLCGHTTLSVDSAQQFMEQRTATGLVEAPVRLRHVAESETEQEAEILTALIQSSIFRHGRQAALTTFDFRNSDEEILVRMMELG